MAFMARGRGNDSAGRRRGRRGATPAPRGSKTSRDGAGALDLPGMALLRVICLVLEDVTLLDLSLVCREWSEVVRLNVCWERKKIFICNRALSQTTLRSWYPRWSLGVVEMTYGQRDMLVAPRQQAHTVHHPWGVPPGLSRARSWVRIEINDTSWLLSLTRYRGPDDVWLLQDSSARRFDMGILVGWTSAASHDEYAHMVNGILRGRAGPGDSWLATTLYTRRMLEENIPLAVHSRTMPTTARFDESSPYVVHLSLDRAGHSFKVWTKHHAEQVDLRQSIPEDLELRVFVAAPSRCNNSPCRAQDVPDVRLGATRYKQGAAGLSSTLSSG